MKELNIIDVGLPLREFEIWIGNHSLGQGYSDPTEPQIVGREMARSFETACLKHELRSNLQAIERLDAEDKYISHQDREWFYKWRENSNTWTGEYYQSKEDAIKSFGN